jgi:hypothetical protein
VTRSEDRDEQAEVRDHAAAQRRLTALARDVAAGRRDQRSRAPADDQDPGFADRYLSAKDRDDAAGDRADAHDDERAARTDREQAAHDREQSAGDRENWRIALESRTVIGQAEGMLMNEYGIDADQAFALLSEQSQNHNVKLRDLAQSVVDAGAKRAAEG